MNKFLTKRQRREKKVAAKLAGIRRRHGDGGKTVGAAGWNGLVVRQVKFPGSAVIIHGKSKPITVRSRTTLSGFKDPSRPMMTIGRALQHPPVRKH